MEEDRECNRLKDIEANTIIYLHTGEVAIVFSLTPHFTNQPVLHSVS